jgi:CheY-like chemotaxis protein
MQDPMKPVPAVLIVEDEALIRMDTASLIEDAGFKVHEAGNADEAIRILELHDEIRLIFTDVNMPGSMDGLKLAHYVRGRWPPVKWAGCWRSWVSPVKNRCIALSNAMRRSCKDG